MLRRFTYFIVGLLLCACMQVAVAQHAPIYYFASSTIWQDINTDRFPTALASMQSGFDKDDPALERRACYAPYNWTSYDIFLGQVKMLHVDGYADGDTWIPYTETLSCDTNAVVIAPNWILATGTEQWATCAGSSKALWRYPGAPCASPTIDLGKSQGKPPAQSAAQPAGQPNCVCGDPINAATGNAFKIKTEYRGDGPFPLELTWTYNSSGANGAVSPTEMVLGTNRTLNYLRSVRVSAMPAGTAGLVSAYLTRGDGNTYVADFVSGAWTLDGDINGTLTSTQDSNGNFTGFAYLNELGQTESYNSAGELTAITDRNGFQQTLTRNSVNTQITSVQDSFGRVLQFFYDTSGRLSKVVQPDSSPIVFAYDANNNLQLVTYPDASFVQYNYGEAAYTSGATLPHALTSVVDEAGVVYDTTTYNAQGFAIADALAGNVSPYAISYQLAVNTTNVISATITGPLGAAQTVTFQPSVSINRPTQQAQTCAGCTAQTDSFTFGTNGLVKSHTDGRSYTAAYDYNGSLQSQVIEVQGQAVQRTTNTTWDTTLRVPLTRKVLDTQNNVFQQFGWTYNTRGQPTARCEIDPTISAAAAYTCTATGTVPAGVRRWTYTYCDAVDSTQCPLIGLLLGATGPRTDLTQTTSYAYYLDDTSTHRHGDLKAVTDALGHVTTLASYDGAGRITRTIDPNSSVTDYTYTPRGWLASRTVRFNPDGSADTYNDATTKISYTAYGGVQTIRDADGVKITYGYDAAHRLTTITDALGNVLQYTLDASGNRTAEKTFATGSSTPSRTLTRTFNSLGQLTQVVDGLNHTVFDASASGSYDGNGNLLQSKDANGIVHQQSYDALNRLVQRIDNLNGADTATRNTTTTQSWDALDRLTKVTDPSNLTTTYGYDGLSNPVSLSSPDSGTSQASFDAAGNMLSRTDANGITVSHSYDALDRRLSDSYADSTLNASYHYDDPDSVVSCSSPGSQANPIGHLTRIVEATVTTTWCYDHNDHLAQQAQFTAGHTDLTWFYFTRAGRLGGRMAPDNVGAFYNYDSAGRVVNVVIPPGQILPNGASPVQQITYLPFGPMTSYRLNSQIITRSYDANYALTDITSTALNLHFARDPLGNIIAEGNTAGASPALESYSYDPLNQLKAITQGSTTVESYSYNPTGDRLSKTAAGLATGTYLYTSGTHQLASINGISRANDANGNTTGSVVGGNTYGFGYNGRNRMTVAQANGATVGTYLYNALGQRIQKTTTAPTTTTQRYFYDEQSHLIGEYTVGGSNRDTIWLGDMPVATVDTTGSTSVVNFVIGDGLGTPRAVVNGAGTTIWSWAYLGNPFGEQQPTSTTGYVLNLRYPGQYYDAESGTNYNLFRTYEPTTGRYLQSDPIGLRAGPSTYAAVNNSPLKYIDPAGLDGILLVNPTAVYLPVLGGYGGHAATLVGNDQSGWNFYSENGYDANNVQQTSNIHYDNIAAFEQAWGSTFIRQMGVPTSAAQDAAMNAWARAHLHDPYHAGWNNCGVFAKHVLQAGGINVQNNLFGPLIPNDMSVDEWNGQVYIPENPYIAQHYNPSMFKPPVAGESSSQ